MTKVKAKAKAKPAAAKKADDNGGESAREKNRKRDDKLREQVVELREQDPPQKWDEIAEELEIQATKALFLYTQAKVKPSQRINPDDLTGELVVELRDEEGLAWHVIAARAGLSTVGPLKRLYEEATGEAPSGRIKKDVDEDDEAEPKAKAKSKSKTKRNPSAQD